MYHSSTTLASVRGPCRRREWTPLIGTFKGKILIDQVDLEKAQNEDSALQMVRSWFNLKTGKIDENKIDTSIFNKVHDDVLQLYKVRKQLRLTDANTTNSACQVENEFDSNPRMRIVIPPSHRYQALLAVHGGRESRVPQIVITATQICFAASTLLNW